MTFFTRQGVQTRYFTYQWVLKDIPAFLDEISKGHRSLLTGVINGGNHLLAVNDVEIYKEITTKDAHKFPVRAGFHLGSPIVNKTLFFMDANDDWKRIRSIVSPAFTSGKLRNMCSPIEAISDKLVENLRPYAKSGDEFDARRLLDAFTMDVISRCAYGIELDSLNQPDHPVIVNAKKILNTNAGLTQLLCGMFPAIARRLGLAYFDSDSVEFFDKLTLQILDKRLKEDNYKRKSFLLFVDLLANSYLTSFYIQNRPI